MDIKVTNLATLVKIDPPNTQVSATDTLSNTFPLLYNPRKFFILLRIKSWMWIKSWVPVCVQVIKSLLTLLDYFDWKQFSIINEEAWSDLAATLKERAEEKTFIVNHHHTVIDRHECCVKRLRCCHSGIWYQIIQETRNKTRSELKETYIN